MAFTDYFEDLNLNKNEIRLFKVNPLSTGDRTTLGGTLGISDEGIFVYDFTLDKPYFWDGTQWINIAGTAGWGLTGNGGIDALTNFFGTVDAEPIIVKTNNTEIARFGTNGYLGISVDPLSKLHIRTNGIAVSQSDSNGILIENASAVNNTVGQRIQMSPPVVWKGSVWYPSFGGTTAETIWRADVLPVYSTFGSFDSYWQLSTRLQNSPFPFGSGQYINIFRIKEKGSLELFESNGTSTLGYGTINSVGVGTSDTATLGTFLYYGTKPVNILTYAGDGANTAIGFNSQVNTTLGAYNTTLGESTLPQLTTGTLNTVAGYTAGFAVTTGFQNSIYGASAATHLTTGFKISAFGAGAAEQSTTAQESVYFGQDAGFTTIDGIYNVFVGVNAKGGSHGLENVIIGYYAGSSLGATNSKNTFVGKFSGNNASQKTDAINSIAIGADSFTTADNQITLGTSINTQNIFWGALMPNSLPGTPGYLLSSLGANTSPVWIDPATLVGTTPAWQQTLTVGSTLTTNNAITLGTNSFIWNSTNTTSVTTSSPIVENFNSLTSGTGHYLGTTSGSINGMKLLHLSSTGFNAGVGISYGLYVSNQTGGISATNVAGYFEAFGTGVDYAAQFARGVVSFGTLGTESGRLRIYGSSTGTIDLIAQAAAGSYEWDWPTTAGTTGYVLTSAGGVGSPMTWTDPTTFTPSGAALTKTDDTNVTLSLSGTPALALLQATSLTLGWTGQLSLARGGTGNSAFTAGSVIFSNGTILTQDNANLFWDDTNNRLGIGTTAPGQQLHIFASASNAAMKVESTLAAGLARIQLFNDGGKIISYSVNGSATANTTLVNIPNTGLIQSTGAGGLVINAADAAGAIIFTTGGTATSTERMHIYSGGIVHIGLPPFNSNIAFNVQMAIDSKRDGTRFYAHNLTAYTSIGYNGIGSSASLDLEGLTGINLLGSASVIYMNMISSGLFKFGSSATPTRVIDLIAGTTTVAPFGFTAGTNLTSPVAGSMEWDGTNLFVTQTTGPTRKTIAYTTDITTINFADEETPSGTINGINTTFTLAHTPLSGSLKVYLNGIRLKNGNDYTLATTTITMINIPGTGDTLIADYRY